MEDLVCFLSFHHLHHHSQHHYFYHHHHFHHDDFWTSNTSRLLNLFEVNNMKHLHGHLRYQIPRVVLNIKYLLPCLVLLPLFMYQFMHLLTNYQVKAFLSPFNSLSNHYGLNTLVPILRVGILEVPSTLPKVSQLLTVGTII